MLPYIILLLLVSVGIIKGDEENRINKKLWYRILCFILLFFTCFHYRLGCDAIEFQDELYPTFPTLDKLKLKEVFNLGSEPFVVLLCSVSKTIWNDYLLFQIIHGLFVNIVLMSFFWKNARYPFVAVLIFLTFAYYNYNFEIQRQSIALCIFLLIEKYIHQKKYLKYYLGTMIAIGFHYSGVVFLLLPFIKDIKINKLSISLLCVSLVGLYFVGRYLQSIPEIALLQFSSDISAKLSVYTNENRSAGESGILNVYILISKVIIPFCLILLGKKYLDEKYHVFLFLFLLFSVSTVVSIPILSRFADYFTPFYIVMLSNYIFTISKVKKPPLLSSIRIFVILIFFTFNFYSWFMIKSYNPKLRNYVKIYPYSSVFFPEKSPDRENAGWKYLY